MSILDSPTCDCGHALAVHDPCSKCMCPGFQKTGQQIEYPLRKPR